MKKKKIVFFFFFGSLKIQEPGFCTNACRVALDSGGSLCTSPSRPATNSTRSCVSVRASWTIYKRRPTSHLRYAPVFAATGQFTEWRTCIRLFDLVPKPYTILNDDDDDQINHQWEEEINLKETKK